MDHKEQYQSYLAQAMSALEHACAHFLPEESEVCRAARYSLLGGGKRIRAVLVLSVCEMLGGNMAAAEQFAAAVEMLHCYSLIHDDLPCMDNDDLRRGRPSCHKAFGESTAMLAGDVLQTDLVANLGYGYVGFNANRVKVGTGNGGDEASKNLRKAIATVIAVYRDVAVDSYYGEFANVINYPISNTSWAAPQASDPGYKVAFSVDVNGNDIYTSGMSADERYAAALQAALGYFEAAGYTVTDGKITAAPADARMDAEVMVGGSGKGDHPSFMALTLASDALKEIGFNLIVSDMSNFAEMTNAINAGTADMFAMAWQATPDPDMFQIYHSQGGSNEKSYWIKDAELDDLIMQARQSTDQTYRKTLYKECLDIVADWAVEIPVYQRQNCIILSSQRVNLDTVTPDITTYWNWYNDLELLEVK